MPPFSRYRVCKYCNQFDRIPPEHSRLELADLVLSGDLAYYSLVPATLATASLTTVAGSVGFGGGQC